MYFGGKLAILNVPPNASQIMGPIAYTGIGLAVYVGEDAKVIQQLQS